MLLTYVVFTNPIGDSFPYERGFTV